MTLLFVYGTLMRGMRNHHKIHEAGTGCYSIPYLLTGYAMQVMLFPDGTSVPLAYPDPEGAILGELWEVSDISVIDAIEKGYKKVLVPEIEAYIYCVPSKNYYPGLDDVPIRNGYQSFADFELNVRG